MWRWSRVVAPERLRQTLSIMCRQLKNERLEIGLASAPEPAYWGHAVRVVNNQNPLWYRKLCMRYPAHRTNPKKRLGKKHYDTRIKRNRVIQTLTNLSAGKEARSIYAFDLLELAEGLEAQWEEEHESKERLQRSEDPQSVDRPWAEEVF